MRDEFAEKTARCHLANKLDSDFSLKMDLLQFSGGTKIGELYRQITIKAEIKGRTLYGVGSFELGLDESVSSALADLESTAQEFESIGEDREALERFLGLHIDARDKFENEGTEELIAEPDIDDIAKLLSGYGDKERALSAANTIDLKETRRNL